MTINHYTSLFQSRIKKPLSKKKLMKLKKGHLIRLIRYYYVVHAKLKDKYLDKCLEISYLEISYLEISYLERRYGKEPILKTIKESKEQGD